MKVARKLNNYLRLDLKTIIVGAIVKIYLAENNGENPNFDEDEEYVVDIDDEHFSVNVEVDDSYLDIEDRVFETIKVNEVHLALDGEIYLVLDNGNEDEIDVDDISTDELTALAELFENKVEEL